MNINAIQNLSPNVAQQITANNDVVNFICSSRYFVPLLDSLTAFLQPVMNPTSGRKVELSYKGWYTHQPHGCCGDNNYLIPMLLFSPLGQPDKNGKIKAVDNTWIARLPLLPNVNSVSVYFPSSIIVEPSVFRFEQYHDDEYDYAIPIVLSDFIKNPEAFLDLVKIQKRVKS
jgi:hypothetical protein